MVQVVIKNHTARWLWTFIVVALILAVIYALPNLYGESPSVQISSKSGNVITPAVVIQVSNTLATANVPVKASSDDGINLTLKFDNTDEQMAAQEALQPLLQDQYVMALNLSPNTPKWLLSLGASPMKYGLDLRGGMYFLLDLDMQVVMQTSLQNDETSLMNDLRNANIHYTAMNIVAGEGIVINLSDAASLSSAKQFIETSYPDLQLIADKQNLSLIANLSGPALKQLQSNAVAQTLQVMRNRVNELGVADAVVAKEGDSRILIELPGVQDATRAKSIIRGTATLKAMIVNDTVNPVAVVASGNVPTGSSIYKDEAGNPYVLYNPVIMTGDAISNATLSYDQQTGAPIVAVTLTGPQVSYFSQVTGQNVGHRMAIILVQSNFAETMVNGKPQATTTTTQTVINAAVIQSQLGNNFQITGIGNARSAQNLALSIRAGALPAPVQIVEEKQIGPSLGIQNIKMGALSVAVALALIMIFIMMYYRFFGVVASVCLLLNLILIVAVMSLIPGATLTLPGIAGIVLNVGMAIDANVLIFERIREELRKGSSNMLSIYTGYQRAFGTIVDANVTTFIVAIILFAVGSGAIKGFAVTLMIGIVTSVFCAVVIGRAIVNAVYGKHPERKLSIGI